jgi:hypothetical protein
MPPNHAAPASPDAFSPDLDNSAYEPEAADRCPIGLGGKVREIARAFDEAASARTEQAYYEALVAAYRTQLALGDPDQQEEARRELPRYQQMLREVLTERSGGVKLVGPVTLPRRPGCTSPSRARARQPRPSAPRRRGSRRTTSGSSSGPDPGDPDPPGSGAAGWGYTSRPKLVLYERHERFGLVNRPLRNFLAGAAA